MKKAIVIFSMLTFSIVMVKCSPKAAKITAATPTETKTTPVTPGVTATAEQIEAGKTLYNTKCGTCHGLKEPSKYTTASWNNILKSMIPKAKLNADDAHLVTAYVMANAKQQ